MLYFFFLAYTLILNFAFPHSSLPSSSTSPFSPSQAYEAIRTLAAPGVSLGLSAAARPALALLEDLQDAAAEVSRQFVIFAGAR